MRWYEVPNNTNFYYYRLHASVLRCLPVTFLLIGPLSLAGMALAAPRIRQLWLLYAMVLTTLLVLLAFGVYSRLRLPMVPPLILFAALTPVSIIRWASSRNFAKLSCLTLALIVLALWMGRPLSPSQPLIRYFDYAAPFQTYYNPRIAEAAARRDPAAAAALLAEALCYEPEELRTLDAGRPITTIDQLKVAMLFVKTRMHYMIALQSCSLRERDAKKREHCAQETTRQHRQLALLNAVILNYPKDPQRTPALAEDYHNLGVAFADCGQVDMAIAYYQKALELKPDFAQAHINLGAVLAGGGQIDEAIDHWGKAVAITPDSAEAHYNLGVALASGGRFDEAIDHYRRFLEFRPDDPIVRNNLGAALADRGEVDEAIRHFRRAIELKADYAPAHYNLGFQLANRGQTAEALEHYQTALALALARNDGALADEIRAQMRRIRPD
jgi:tetratricopeptide (TPR) repeat protein